MAFESLEIPQSADKETVLDSVESFINQIPLEISEVDNQRPWGGFFVISKESEEKFIGTFFPEVDKENIYKYGQELSPKILVVAPNEQLSWQYHHRRAELWKSLAGTVGIMVSDTDEKPDSHQSLSTGELVQHDNQVRHRLIGLDDWGVLAEIWQHTDPEQQSNEDDIVRLEDSYGRTTPEQT